MLFESDPAQIGRPAGVTALACVMLGYALVAFAYALLLARGTIAMSSGAWLIGGGFEIMGKWIFVLYGALHAACGVGLLRLQKWALRFSSLLLVWGVIQVTPAISSAVADSRVYAIIREGIQILWRVVALRYIWLQSTRDAFSAPREKPHPSQA
ncbi:MAG TPA: hypothetical protein VF135_00580 [Terriglobales bacterium]